ncbi:hypothetical protein ACHAW5_003412 [Stephanodiscus triporus]|uniref:Uncharacterized protein n=1 Tax=Stephanodiscus triporus TaxID=2934178 RepID=A0ABD3N2G7_9STRA
MDSAKDMFTRGSDYFNCRLMPHGAIILVPAVCATMGLCASLADDGCDYARLHGSAVEMLTGSNIVPYVDCGMSAYRIPGYYPAENSWRVVYTEECQSYANMDLLADTSWVAAEWLRFMGLVVGMTTSMFMWTATFLTLRPNYWRASGFGAATACLCQVCSFVWFYTKMCHTTTTNFDDFSAGREGEMNAGNFREDYHPSTCSLFFGSRCSIASSFLWAAAAALVLLREYPMPVPRLIAYDEKILMMPPSASGQKQPARGGGGDRGMKVRNKSLTKSQQSSQSSSQRSLKIVSGTPPPAAAVPDKNVRASLRTSVRPVAPFDSRPGELKVSTLSDASFV